MVKWQKISEENYPEHPERTVICWISPGMDEPGYSIYADCPFGWNVLCKMDAWVMVLPDVLNDQI